MARSPKSSAEESVEALLLAIEASPSSVDDAMVCRLVRAIRGAQQAADRWDFTGLPVSRQVRDAVAKSLWPL